MTIRNDKHALQFPDDPTSGTQVSLAGIDPDTLAIRLQRDCMQSFAMSGHGLMARHSAMRMSESCGRDQGQAPANPPANRR